MDMVLSEKNLELLKKYFRNQPVNKVYVFGSFARNEADENSDLDLLLDLDYSQKIGLKFFQMALDLEKILQFKVDLVSSEGVSPYILSSISKDQKLIYAR
jgi:predicted nucleotidyltransferase